MVVAIASVLAVLFVVWRVRRRRRQELLAGVELYRGPRWRVRSSEVVYWDGSE